MLCSLAVPILTHADFEFSTRSEAFTMTTANHSASTAPRIGALEHLSRRGFSEWQGTSSGCRSFLLGSWWLPPWGTQHPLRPMSAGRQASLTLILSKLTDAGSVLMA